MINEVKIFEWKKIEGTSHFEKVEKGTGQFCEWGCSYEEFETGPGNYSTAIIKMPDGTIATPPADMIQFINNSI